MLGRVALPSGFEDLFEVKSIPTLLLLDGKCNVIARWHAPPHASFFCVAPPPLIDGISQ
jgi:hypothetical protein